MQWTENLCRICGLVAETSYSIFAKNSTNNIQEKIKKCLNLHFIDGDCKPNRICTNCLIKLNEFSEFIDMSCATNEKFKSILFDVTHSDYHNNMIKKRSVIVNNTQALDNNITKDISGNKQKTMYTTISNILPHKRTSPNVVIQEVISISRVPYLNCNTINTREIQDKNDDNAQKKLISVEDIQKLVVRSSAQTPKPDLVRSQYTCPHCPRRFLRRGNLNAHLANHTNIRPHACDECPKTFAVKSDLTTHRKIHNDLHKCQICGKCFPAPSKLERHFRTHTNNRPFECDFAKCDKAFSDKRNLDSHKSTHVLEKKFCCEICKKYFKSKHNLSEHLKVHFCKTRHQCDGCNKVYKYKSNLTSHFKKCVNGQV